MINRMTSAIAEKVLKILEKHIPTIKVPTTYKRDEYEEERTSFFYKGVKRNHPGGKEFRFANKSSFGSFFIPDLDDMKKRLQRAIPELKQIFGEESLISIDSYADNPFERWEGRNHVFYVSIVIPNESSSISESSIYDKMNKIDDEESLSEKYNVKNIKELKALKEAGSRLTVDAEGLQRNLPIVIKKIIGELPFEITSHRLSGSIERAARPVRYNFNGDLYLTVGKNAKSRYPIYDDKEVHVGLLLTSLPTNCELTVKLLEEMYREEIVEDILYYVQSTDSIKTNEAQYRAVEKEFQDALKPLESKYNVTLSASLYPKIEEFSRTGGCITDYVRITSVSGKLGQLKKKDSGYYDYEIDGTSYSSYLRYKEHNVSPCKQTDIKDFDANLVAQETSKRIEDLLNSIDTLDNLIRNEPEAEKQMTEYISSLQSKYTDATITVTRYGRFKPQYFLITYEKEGAHWELEISLEDVVNSFDKVKSRIQRKLYRKKKPDKPSYFSQFRTELNFDQD